MEEANTIHDVIVIGGGLMGSSAAWHVSNQKSVLLIEKQGPNYDSGSSKGQARICRCSNIENDELWSYLHNCSVREVEKLIDFLNQNGEDRTMKDVYTTSPVSYIARLEDLNQLLANLAKQNVIFDIDVSGGLRIKRKFPEETLAVFVKPPSIDELKIRLKKRKTESDDKINMRIAKASAELATAPLFDVIIENDNLEKALNEAEVLISDFVS